jgi:hypothetical protein
VGSLVVISRSQEDWTAAGKACSLLEHPPSVQLIAARFIGPSQLETDTSRLENGSLKQPFALLQDAAQEKACLAVGDLIVPPIEHPANEQPWRYRLETDPLVCDYFVNTLRPSVTLSSDSGDAPVLLLLLWLL